MTVDIIRQRLYNQRLTPDKFTRPEQVVGWFGAMQAQSYHASRWAVGLRCDNGADAAVQQAINDKRIVRTWLLRGTLHLAAADDVRWLLTLLAPRLLAGSVRRHQQLDLDETTFARSHEVLQQALSGGQQLTRAEVMAALEQAGISTAGQRGYHMLWHAGLHQLTCFGPPQGKQETFVLLDDWVPQGRILARETAVAELAQRYFRSHGPASLADFIWWSGLKTAVARAALEAIHPGLHEETVAEQTYYWLPPETEIPREPPPAVYLLPAFDEYFLGYQLRQAMLDSDYNPRVVSSNGIFRPMVVIDGQIVGIWKQAVKQDTVVITPDLFRTLGAAELEALRQAAGQYGVFLGKTAVLAA